MAYTAYDYDPSRLIVLQVTQCLIDPITYSSASLRLIMIMRQLSVLSTATYEIWDKLITDSCPRMKWNICSFRMVAGAAQRIIAIPYLLWSCDVLALNIQAALCSS